MRYHHCAVTLSGAIYVMGGIVGRSADHVEQGSGQKISNSVIRIRPLEEKWTEMQSMLEDRSTFSCAVWNGWIWVRGSIFHFRSNSVNFHFRSISVNFQVLMTVRFLVRFVPIFNLEIEVRNIIINFETSITWLVMNFETSLLTWKLHSSLWNITINLDT